MSKRREKGKKSDVCQRIVETAEQLFYSDGVRSVGIDRIIAEAAVAKMSLYNHFASKDDLILAVLKFREEKFDAMFEPLLAKHVVVGKDRIAAFFAALKDWFQTPGFRGCMFINSYAELADAEHEGLSLRRSTNCDSFQPAIGKRFHGLRRLAWVPSRKIALRSDVVLE
ncbi:TetR/AcrR family transcriptional regulator [Rosistilla oblonga]|uniref:TetR/AcrR family transcriptional regulator n=1 Tax=Rosistilla oblonga TaxID=2527990 RepID=UPI003A9778A3